MKEKFDYFLFRLPSIVLLVILIMAVTAFGGIVYQAFFDQSTSAPQRVSTKLVDDGKYLVIYKQKVEGQTIYAPVFLDKGERIDG